MWAFLRSTLLALPSPYPELGTTETGTNTVSTAKDDESVSAALNQGFRPKAGREAVTV